VPAATLAIVKAATFISSRPETISNDGYLGSGEGSSRAESVTVPAIRPDWALRLTAKPLPGDRHRAAQQSRKRTSTNGHLYATSPWGSGSAFLRKEREEARR
jgi:hypothetical protein